MRRWLVVAMALALACGDDDGATDGGIDASGSDSGGMDTGVDAPVSEDSGTDAGFDAGFDAGSTESPGCVDGSGLPEGENTLSVGGLDRRFILRLPIGYSTDRAWPLVLALHGNGGSASYWDGTSGSRNIREVLQDDAVLIVAEAIEGNWRDYDAPSDTWPARIDQELEYFDEVIGMARAELCLDEAETFAMGFSGGGSFSGVLGCRRTDIRAIAVGGSVIYFDEADCVGYPAAWITIGTMELSGREPFRDYWIARGGCEATGTGVDPNPSECTAYDGCNPDTPVQYCQHPGGHVWPDYGSQAMWDFFSQFVD